MCENKLPRVSWLITEIFRAHFYYPLFLYASDLWHINRKKILRYWITVSSLNELPLQNLAYFSLSWYCPFSSTSFPFWDKNLWFCCGESQGWQQSWLCLNQLCKNQGSVRTNHLLVLLLIIIPLLHVYELTWLILNFAKMQ